MASQLWGTRLGSISSELCEMQRLRERNDLLAGRDAEWQAHVMGPRARARALKPEPDPVEMNAPPPLPERDTTLPATPTEERPDGCNNPSNTSAPSTSGISVATSLAPSPSLIDVQHQEWLQSARPRAKDSTSAVRRERGVGKIRRHRMTKEEEARFAPEALRDLRGTTAAKSRKMSDEERDVMLHKRRLRNRASAARSRDKQRRTVNEVSEELDELLALSQNVQARCLAAEVDNLRLKLCNDALRRENAELRQNSMPPQPPKGLRRTASAMRIAMSSDMLDKFIAGDSGSSTDYVTANANASPRNSSMRRIPSKLRISMSTEKLADYALLPTVTGSLPPLSRNLSFIERLLENSNYPTPTPKSGQDQGTCMASPAPLANQPGLRL